MRSSILGFYLAVVGLLTPSYALADAATHSVSFTSIKDMKSDCMGTSCVPYCVIRARLTNLRSALQPAERLTVRLIWPAENRPEPTADLDLSFPAAEKGMSEETTGDAPVPCRKIRVSKVEAYCTDKPDRCPTFFYIQMPDAPKLRLKKQKVEAK